VGGRAKPGHETGDPAMTRESRSFRGLALFAEFADYLANLAVGGLTTSPRWRLGAGNAANCRRDRWKRRLGVA